MINIVVRIALVLIVINFVLMSNYYKNLFNIKLIIKVL